jgi:peptidoglycan/xylan/chitin deacetylase (PgdA/CDA1 family)
MRHPLLNRPDGSIGSMFDLTLSFDNGPDPDVTPFVLNRLAERGLRTTFFVMGHKLTDPRNRALAQRAAAEGHWIGNHTWSHAIPLGRLTDPAIVRHEILDTQRELGCLAHDRKFFRPFGGGGVLGRHLLDREALRLLVEGDYTCVLWNAVPRDWVEPDAWIDTALAQCRLHPWSLMVLHDLPTGAMRHLPRFLDRVTAEGAVFRQDFPPHCVPIERGRITGPIEDFVTV